MTMEGLRLLILDDDPAIGGMILDIAQSAGVEARYIPDPEEFFAAIRDWKPTHVTVDLKMPQMDGVEVMMRLAKMEFRGAIVISSGVGERVLDAAARSAVEHGLVICGVLSKPFSPSALRSLLTANPVDLQQPVGRPDSARKQFEVTPSELEKCLSSHQLHVFYQPKVECASGRLVGYEALCRWIHPEHGIIPPDKFILLAESWDMIEELTRQVIDQSLGFLARLIKHSGADAVLPRIAVNMSAKLLRRHEFVEQALAACAAHGIPPDLLIFELTESSAMENAVDSLAMLTRLRVKEFHLSIDDFGTGYSSMLQLVKLPFSEIKIDRSFVMALGRSEDAPKVVKSIVSLGQSLKLLVVAEGVETLESLKYLKSIGCDIAQGYLISRPLPEADLLAWIESKCPNGLWIGSQAML
ncbi:MAG: EAL domain-containing response regulator [Terracidiphilus sp.]|nr:EAL domain-containing response regulator [Terracidiphilus sp.]MDR3776325.1 EAL domain-containing response regulator [Terracidiphilus sp.]